MGCELRFDANPQKTGIVMKMIEDGREVVSWLMETPEVDEHIRSLAGKRGGLVEEVPHSLDSGSLIRDAVTDPAINVFQASAEQVSIAYRHPGLGWLGIGLTRPVAEALVQRLEDWLKQPTNQ